MYRKLVLGFLILLALGLNTPAVAQEATSPDNAPQITNAEDIAALKLFVFKIFRLVIASAYIDPALVLQELDTVEPYLKEAEHILSTQAEADMENFRNVLSLLRLYPLTEFGLLEEYRATAEPLIAKSQDPNHTIAALVMGFRAAHAQAKNTQARHYLDRAIREATQNPAEVYQVSLYTLETFDTMQSLAEGEHLTSDQMATKFRQAWSKLDGYDPNADMASNVTWFDGRIASRFWITQFAHDETHGKAELGKLLTALDSWGENFAVKPTGGVEDIDLLQGAVILAMSSFDIYLAVLEERPDLVPEAAEAGFFENLDKRFDALDKVTRQIEQLFTLEGFPPFELHKTAFLQELKLRYEVLRTLDPEVALEARQTALDSLAAEARQIEAPESFVQNHIRIGRVYRELKQPQKAIDMWEVGYNKASATGYKNLALQSAQLLSKEFGQQKNWDKASIYATRVSEGLEEEVAHKEVAQVALRTRNAASGEAQAYLNSSNPEKALVALDRGRQLSTAAAKLSGDPEAKSAAQGLAQSEKTVASLNRSVTRLRLMPQSGTRDQMLADAEKLLAKSRAEFLTESRKIRAKYPGLYSSTLRFDPLNLAEVKRSLPPGVAVVQYFPTQDDLYIFVVDQNQFRLRSVGVNKRELDSTILRFHRQLQDRSPGEATTARKLHKQLVAPILSDISGAQQLVLIPTGRLNILPFGALLGDSGKRLVEEKRLVELAKTTDFNRIANSKAGEIGGVTAFTNATLDLPAADLEGKKILKLFPGSTQYQGKEASKRNLMQNATTRDVLHLATHGTWDANDSLNNHLRLANNEKLGQEEIFNLDLGNTSIVTLSACSTALGNAEETGYVASLAEAFWIAGSHTVVASLWPVEDNSTALLMEEFYGGIKRGLSRSEALRLAQIKVKKNPAYAHPYFWSGFVAFGDYR